MARINSDTKTRNKHIYRYFADYKGIDISVQAPNKRDAQHLIDVAIGYHVKITHKE